jgi:L-threonylcarbamoyladenylate synthase
VTPTSPLILSAADPQNIQRTATILRKGGVAVVPTDTVYGIAADAFQPDAVRRVFEIKHRPTGAAMPILLGTAADIPLVARRIPRAIWRLIGRYWPGPLTIVLLALPSVDQAITGAGGTVAVRVPGSNSCLQLLASFGTPLVGTSANVSGHPAAGTAREAFEQIGGIVDVILEDDASLRGVASTVVELSDDGWKVHREGAVTIDDIADVMGPTMDRIPYEP